MPRTGKRLFWIAAAIATVLPAALPAQVFNTSFGGAGYSCLNQVNGPDSCAAAVAGRPLSYIWSAGDYWRQSISGSGLASISSVAFNLNLRNALLGSSTMTFDVWVNGLNVGSSTTYADNGGANMMSAFGVTFSSIAASDYTVELRVRAPSVPVGGGSLGLYTDGRSGITLTSSVVPEPSTYALMAAGLSLMGIAARRRRVR